MKYATYACCALLAASLPVGAQAADVYPGCAKPSVKSGHRTFYVDPMKGSSGGDGSIAKPWKTLSEVFSSGKISTMGRKKPTDALTAFNPNGPVKAGDVIMLMNGNHGSVWVQNAFNTDFITVMAAPGQTPVVNDITISSSAKWVFQGIKFQSAEPLTSTDTSKRAYNPLVWVERSNYFGSSSDIVFDNDVISSADDTSKWGDADWLIRTKYYGVRINTSCVSVTNSTVTNVLNGFALYSPKSLIQNNTIRNFSNDGIDFVSGDLIIKGNVIKDGVNVSSSPWHADGMQGWSATVNRAVVKNSNILIDSNTVVKYGDPDKSYMQGISIFDGDFDNVTIQNNVVVSNTWNALTTSGMSNSKILNNTVIASEPVKHQSWISVNPSSTGKQPSNVIVRNNIAPSIRVPKTGVTYDHNIVGGMYAVINGKQIDYLRKSDTSKAMIVLPSIEPLFTSINNSTGSYDLRLKTASSALGTGSATAMPVVDIVQRTRKTPVDPGAYTR